MTPMDTPTGSSRHHLRVQIAKFSTVVRHCSCLMMAMIALLAPAAPGIANTAIMTGLAAWAIYRLITRSQSATAVAGDVAWTVAIGAALPVLTVTVEFSLNPVIPAAIVAVSVATLALQLPVWYSVALLTMGLSAYAFGAYHLIGWPGAVQIVDLYAIAAGWIIAILLRAAIDGVARTADRVYQDRLSTEVGNGIADAHRKADREQLASLHDTAAATLLLVGHTAVPAERLAARASRDLSVLQAQPVQDFTAPVDVVAQLRNEITYLELPINYTGLDHLWLDGERAHAVGSASREALNNVDRHAHASSVTIYATRHRLEIIDNGRGFVTESSRGHGISQSIVARMRDIGGDANIYPAPGGGTTVALHWSDDAGRGEPADAGAETDRLVRSLKTRYCLALIVSGLAVLFVGLWRVPMSESVERQVGLAVAAALCALAATPKILNGSRWAVWGITACLVGISVAQHGLIAEAAHRSTADWTLGVVGFCLMPMLLRLPAGRGVPILLSVWAIPALVDLIRDLSIPMAVNLGVTASTYLVPQVAACLFGNSVRAALLKAHRENDVGLRLHTKEAVAQAMQSECGRRYSETVDRLLPLLRAVAESRVITEELRSAARAECRSLRNLFDHSGVESTQLSKRIQALIGIAEERGVSVTAHVDRDLPNLASSTADHVLDHVDAALGQARTWARLIVTTAYPDVDLSVVCDVSEPAIERRRPTGGAQVVVADDTMWITLRAG
jgi:hypothetical protein